MEDTPPSKVEWKECCSAPTRIHNRVGCLTQANLHGLNIEILCSNSEGKPSDPQKHPKQIRASKLGDKPTSLPNADFKLYFENTEAFRQQPGDLNS